MDTPTVTPYTVTFSPAQSPLNDWLNNHRTLLVAASPNGDIFVSHRGYYRVLKIDTSNRVTIAVGPGSTHTELQAPLEKITTLFFGFQGELYIGDQAMVHMYLNSTLTNVVGSNLGRSLFGKEYSAAVGPDGIIVVTKCGINRAYVINGSYCVVSIGTGRAGHADGSFSSCSLSHPRCVAFDASGASYIGTNTSIRSVDHMNSTVATYAGAPKGGYRDGPKLKALFNAITSILANGSNSHTALYVCDSFNHRIRLISSNGTVSTIVGSGKNCNAGGIGTRASLSYPCNLSRHPKGDLLVGGYNSRLMHVSGVFNGPAPSGAAGIVRDFSPLLRSGSLGPLGPSLSWSLGSSTIQLCHQFCSLFHPTCASQQSKFHFALPSLNPSATSCNALVRYLYFAPILTEAMNFVEAAEMLLIGEQLSISDEFLSELETSFPVLHGRTKFSAGKIKPPKWAIFSI